MTTQKVEDDSLPQLIKRSNVDYACNRILDNTTQTDCRHLHPVYSTMIKGLKQHGNNSSPQKVTVTIDDKVAHREVDLPIMCMEGDHYNFDKLRL